MIRRYFGIKEHDRFHKEVVVFCNKERYKVVLVEVCKLVLYVSFVALAFSIYFENL